MSDNFFSRWARRKSEARETDEALETETAKAQSDAKHAVQNVDTVNRSMPIADNLYPQVHLYNNEYIHNSSVNAAAQDSAPALTLDDVRTLTPESDFKPFVAKGVDPQVKNAALKKLWVDPRYNIQDGLDTYIDDYSKPDPIPQSMLRQMVQAKFLKLFDDEEDQQKQQGAKLAEAAPPQIENPASIYSARLEETTPAPHLEPHDQDPDLRLQQDNAARLDKDRAGAG